MSSLRDVINLQRRQQTRFNDLKQDLMNKLTEKIIHLAKHGETRCIYTIPNYTFGFPKYNVSDITTHLYIKVMNEGLCVVILSDNKLFISWDITDINNIKNESKRKKQSISDLKPLLNIKR
jgi:hypothetical protein